MRTLVDRRDASSPRAVLLQRLLLLKGRCSRQSPRAQRMACSRTSIFTSTLLKRGTEKNMVR